MVVVDVLVAQVQVGVVAWEVGVVDKVVADKSVAVVDMVVDTDTVAADDTVVVVKRSCSTEVETFSHLCRKDGSL